MRASKAFRFSNSFGEVAKFEKSEPLVGDGYRFKTLIAFGSSRPAGRMFSPEGPNVKLVVLAAQVPKGSRTKPVLAATKPETGSAAPAVTGRVVAGSKMVPTGINRPNASARAA